MAFLDITFPQYFATSSGDELKFNNYVLRTDGGHRGVNQVASLPRLEFNVKMTFACKEEYEKLYAFFMTCVGNVHSFKVAHPIAPEFKDYVIGTGDGVKTAFQIGIISTYNGTQAIRPLKHFEGLTVKVNNVIVTTGFSLVDGLLTFDTPVPVGEDVTVTGKYFFEMAFVKDSLPTTYTSYNNSKSTVKLEEIIY